MILKATDYCETKLLMPPSSMDDHAKLSYTRCSKMDACTHLEAKHRS